jgi:hypothetical protein
MSGELELIVEHIGIKRLYGFFFGFTEMNFSQYCHSLDKDAERNL